MINLLIRLGVKDGNDLTNKNVRNRYGMLAGFVGIICNFALSLIKMILGLMTHTLSIVADGFNNLSDATSSVVTWIGFKVANKPADSEHPFGHGRAEYVAGLIVSLAIIAIAINILMVSVNRLIQPIAINANYITILALVLSIVTKLWMSRFYKTIGDRIHSVTMDALVKDSLGDCIATSVSLLSVILYLFFHINIDGLAGLIVSLFILKAGIEVFKDASSLLLGSPDDPDIRQHIFDIALAHDHVLGVHDFEIHEYGPDHQHAIMHLEVPESLSLKEAHNIADEIERTVRVQGYVSYMTIHIDPVDVDDPLRSDYYDLMLIIVHDIDENFSIHDFRIDVSSNKKTASFDLVIPYDYVLSDEDIIERINELWNKDHPDISLQIIIDHN